MLRRAIEKISNKMFIHFISMTKEYVLTVSDKTSKQKQINEALKMGIKSLFNRFKRYDLQRFASIVLNMNYKANCFL